MESRVAQVGRRIRRLREDLGFTAEAMAEATGCGLSEYASIEGGEQDVTLTFLYRCADELGVEVADLLAEESAERRPPQS